MARDLTSPAKNDPADVLAGVEPITEEGREFAMARASRVIGPDKSSHPWANVARMYEVALRNAEAEVARHRNEIARRVQP